MLVIVVYARIVTALVENPFFFTRSQLSLKLSIVLANHALERVVVAVAEVVSSIWNSSWSLDIV